MPVNRTPDGRIVEERTTVTPPGANPGGNPERKSEGRDEPVAAPAEGNGAVLATRTRRRSCSALLKRVAASSSARMRTRRCR